MASPSIVASSSSMLGVKNKMNEFGPTSLFSPSTRAHGCRTRAMNPVIAFTRPAQSPRSLATAASVKHAVTVKGKMQTGLENPLALVNADAELFSRSTIGSVKPEIQCLASISSSSTSTMTASKGVPPLLTSPYIGSPLLWIGIGFGLGVSAIFQVRDVLLRLIKRKIDHDAAQSVQSNSSAFVPGSEFTYPAGSTSSPNTVQVSTQPVSNSDVHIFEVDPTLLSEGICEREMQKPQKKYGSLDVSAGEVLQAGPTYTKESTNANALESWSEKEVTSRVFFLNSNPWTVPWTAETIIQVMLLWIASFWFVGSWIIPFLAHAAGFSKESLTHRGQALYSLLTDVAEGLAGIAILHQCLAKFHPLPQGWFCFSIKGNWHFDVGLGCLLFPLVNFLSQVNINLVPTLPALPVGVSSVEQSIVARDPVAMVLYALVVSICAPIWEEVLFRGFLLPSLTRYMPISWSILISAVAFALAHFNAQRMLPLVFLGVVMGAVFAKSKNLLASMLLHSLWNGFVFLDLMK